MNPRINVGSGVTGAVRYVLGQGRDPKTGELKELAPDEQSRVAWIGGQGALALTSTTAADADRARRVMEFDALNQKSRTRRCEQDCVHLSLAWRPGETPTPPADGRGGARRAEGARHGERQGASSSPTMTRTTPTFISSPRRSIPRPAAPTISSAARSSFPIGPWTMSVSMAASFRCAGKMPTSCAPRSATAMPAPCSRR